MKNTVERFQQEHRQLTTKVSAMQMGINQFEREAAIRSHVERELSLEKSKVLLLDIFLVLSIVNFQIHLLHLIQLLELIIIE